MKKNIMISSSFGHEIMAINFAKALGFKVVILPNKENREEYNAESLRIFETLRFFGVPLFRVSFERREQYRESSWDLIADLKRGILSDNFWGAFAQTSLSPLTVPGLPRYYEIEGRDNTLFVPQKLVSDGQCGISAEQQSLPLEVFDFLKAESNLVLGQHFHKVNDLEKVEALASEFDIYVPGLTENPEVFGIRGVKHQEYYHMYRNISRAIGIAGTHTWILLTMFPNVPQVILFNKNGAERWEVIEKAYQRAGRKIFCIGFDETTDLQELSQEIEQKFKLL